MRCTLWVVYRPYYVVRWYIGVSVGEPSILHSGPPSICIFVKTDITMNKIFKAKIFQTNVRFVCMGNY